MTMLFGVEHQIEADLAIILLLLELRLPYIAENLVKFACVLYVYFNVQSILHIHICTTNWVLLFVVQIYVAGQSYNSMCVLLGLIVFLILYIPDSCVLFGSGVINARPGSANSFVNLIRFNSYCRPESCINIMTL
jgi:hypothetical protein